MPLSHTLQCLRRLGWLLALLFPTAAGASLIGDEVRIQISSLDTTFVVESGVDEDFTFSSFFWNVESSSVVFWILAGPGDTLGSGASFTLSDLDFTPPAVIVSASIVSSDGLFAGAPDNILTVGDSSLAVDLSSYAGGSLAGVPSIEIALVTDAAPPPTDPVIHPTLWNAITNDPNGPDEPPGLGTAFASSPTQSSVDTIEDAFGNADGGVEPSTFIFSDSGVPDNGNDTMGDGETVDFIEWQTTSPVDVQGYRLLLSQLDAVGREIELFRFLVDGNEFDYFDNDSATGPDNSTVLDILRPFGQEVTGSTFRAELTRASNGPRIWEIDALTESFCGNSTVEGPEECDDGGAVSGDGCDALCMTESICPVMLEGGCITAAKASLLVKEKKRGNEKLKATFKRFDGTTEQGDFGDPVAGSTLYDLCLYDGQGELLDGLSVGPKGTCGPKDKDCWKAKRDKGWAYKDKDAESSGVKKVVAISGPSGKGKLVIQAGNKSKKGQDDMPTGITGALQGALSATVQLRTSDGVCVEGALSVVKKNDTDLFKAKTP